MFSAVDLRIGSVFLYKDEPYKVLEFKHTHMGRGSADVRLKIRGILNGSIVQVVFAPGERFEEANLTKKKMQFLYKDGDSLFFMDPISYEQIELNRNELGDEVDFLQDGETYNVAYWDEKAINVEMPPKVVVEVIDCDPGVKGNSASNMYKSGMVTGNIPVRIPLFIEKGEKIRIDTFDRKYVERAK